MAIRAIEQSKTLKKWGAQLGRQEIAERIIAICERVAAEKHYINAVKAAGEIRALTEACKHDCYWQEKFEMGFELQLDKAEFELKQQLPTPPTSKN